MNDRKELWYDSDDPGRVVRGGAWRVGLVVLAVLAVIGLISVGVWYFGVATSGVKGTGDITKQNNSAGNRVYSQQHFQDLYGDIQSYRVQMVQAAQDKADHPGDDYYATNYTGLYNTCVTAVNQYDADAQKILARDWRDPSLPQNLDAATTCTPATTPTSAPNPGVTPSPSTTH